MSDALPLDTVQVLYRDREMQLWGIPYKMRPGQQPRDLQDAHHDYVPPRYGHYGSKQTSIADWIWLGSPGWWGHYNKEQQEDIKDFLKMNREYVPQGPYEWSELPDENPIEVDAKITGTDLLLIAGGVVALGLVGYLIWAAQVDAAAAETGGVASPEANTSEQGQFVNTGNAPLGPASSTGGLDPALLTPLSPPSTYPLQPLPVLGKSGPPPIPGSYGQV
jgi:hypothetical protein